MRKIYILPNLFTTASLFCGLLAIVNIFEGQYELACTLILISIVMDALDGRIARLTRTQSSFGLNYDSLSDIVAFGVAPAMLIFTWLQAISDASSHRVATGVSILFAICGALRLARFNVQVIKEERKKFVGLPIPAAAGAVVATFLTLWKSGLLFDQEDSFVFRLLPLLFIGLSCLMVSNIPYPSWKRIDLERRKPFDYLVAIIIVICLIVALWQFRPQILFLGFWSYVCWGILGSLLHLHRPNEETFSQAPRRE
ncbi:CDP-diacylglycerol--serine O-phosphatidyltransferase [Candidatus Sumerlaeota bacterium]|nr:CDP-diacylglycerol--serine O-phosphatidyltransferase [Candidatus Sumerlaeota bacterium]